MHIMYIWKNLFTKVFSQNIQPITMDFISLLLKKGRESILPAILEKYNSLHNKEKNIIVAELISSKNLENSLVETIKDKLSVLGSVTLKKTLNQDSRFERVKIRKSFQENPTLYQKIERKINKKILENNEIESKCCLFFLKNLIFFKFGVFVLPVSKFNNLTKTCQDQSEITNGLATFESMRLEN